jgi:hypothetical protein
MSSGYTLQICKTNHPHWLGFKSRTGLPCFKYIIANNRLGEKNRFAISPVRESMGGIVFLRLTEAMKPGDVTFRSDDERET